MVKSHLQRKLLKPSASATNLIPEAATFSTSKHKQHAEPMLSTAVCVFACPVVKGELCVARGARWAKETNGQHGIATAQSTVFYSVSKLKKKIFPTEACSVVVKGLK